MKNDDIGDCKFTRKYAHIIADNNHQNNDTQQTGLIARTDYNTISSYTVSNCRIARINLGRFGIKKKSSIGQEFEKSSNIFILLQQFANDAYVTNQIKYHYHLVPKQDKQNIILAQYDDCSAYTFFDSVIPHQTIQLKFFNDNYEEIIIPSCNGIISSDNIIIDTEMKLALVYKEQQKFKDLEQHEQVIFKIDDCNIISTVNIIKDDHIELLFRDDNFYKLIQQCNPISVTFIIVNNKIVPVSSFNQITKGTYIIETDSDNCIGKLIKTNKIQILQQDDGSSLYIDSNCLLSEDLQKYQQTKFCTKLVQLHQKQIPYLLPQKKITISLAVELLYAKEDRSFYRGDDFDAMVNVDQHPYAKVIQAPNNTFPMNQIYNNMMRLPIGFNRNMQ